MIKKLILTLTSILVFIMMFSCASFKPRLVEDDFYNNNYFTTENYYWLGNASGRVGVIYETQNGTSNINMKFIYGADNYETSYTLAIKYKDDSIETLTGGSPKYNRLDS